MLLDIGVTLYILPQLFKSLELKDTMLIFAYALHSLKPSPTLSAKCPQHKIPQVPIVHVHSAHSLDFTFQSLNSALLLLAMSWQESQ